MDYSYSCTLSNKISFQQVIINCYSATFVFSKISFIDWIVYLLDLFSFLKRLSTRCSSAGTDVTYHRKQLWKKAAKKMLTEQAAELQKLA